MTKKKDDQVEEVKQETKPLVSVEMTEAEKAEFVAYKAKKDKELEDQKEAEELVEFTLKYGHNVNGVSYGPGRVRCRSDLGYALLSRDEKALQARLRVHESNEFIVHILGHGKSTVKKVNGAGV
jgi:hypothetical protein